MAALGNQNAAKGKRWCAAIERSLARRVSGTPRPNDGSALMQGIDAAADEFVSLLFTNKDLACFRELGDRLDGKPHQTLEAEVTGNLAGVLAGLGRTESQSDDPPVAG